MRAYVLAVGALAAGALLIHAATAQAYKVVDVKNGGVVQGVVEFVGNDVPTDPSYVVSADAAYCGSSVAASRYLITKKKIKNVVVFLEHIEAGKPLPRTDVVLANRRCEMAPHVTIGFTGNRITATNYDPILHLFDVHSFSTGKELYHFSLHDQGSSVTKPLPGSGLFMVSDYIHPWEHALVYVFDQPYVALTDENGAFVIDTIPPGEYTVTAWHEDLGIVRTKVKVESGKSRTLTIRYPAK